jgi:flavin-dependent dehydrogenase
MNVEEDEVDVVIVGAGVAGLSAGYQLRKKDPSIRVLVLEAKGWQINGLVAS